MTTGRIHTLSTGKRIHLGGRRPPTKKHALLLARGRYGLHLPSWPATPTSTSYAAAPGADAVLRDVLGNDELGDCTAANSFHLQALRQAAAGCEVFHPTVDDVVKIYSRDGGYVPGNPATDQGADEITVLMNAQVLGIPKDGTGCVDKIAGFVAIDATDRDLVRKCATAFVGATITMALPDAWLYLAEPTEGGVWDVPAGGFVPNPDNGHCFSLLDQDDGALTIGTWGMKMRLTYEALAAGAVDAMGGGLYALLSEEVLSSAAAKAPDGLDWAALANDFASLRS